MAKIIKLELHKKLEKHDKRLFIGIVFEDDKWLHVISDDKDNNSNFIN